MLSFPTRDRWARWTKVAFHPPKYLVASLIVSLGGLLNGCDSGTIGPVIVMPQFEASLGTLSPSLAGTVVSSILIPATIISLFSGALADSLGRTRALAIGGLLFAVGAALEASAVSLAMFIAGRCIVGAGEGFFLSTMVVYVCEIAPPNQRGPLATTVQVFITMGLVVGFFACYGTVGISSSLSWRLPLALQSGIAFVLAMASTFYLPQSPRWLAHKGRKEEASRAWDKLGVSGAEREKNLLQESAPADGEERPAAPSQARAPTMRKKLSKNLKVLTAAFRGEARKPMLLGVFLMSMQQLSGIDGVIYYAPLLFQQAGLESSQAKFLASGVSAICIFAFTILAVIFVDRWGRRASTIYGGLVLFICMATMATLYATQNVHPTKGIGRWVVILMIYVFAIVYSMTWAIGIKLFASEIQPAATRATAQALAQSGNCLSNFFVALITPVILAQSSSAIYFLFGSVLALGIGVSVIYMPETKGRDLESVSEAFGMHKVNELPIVLWLKQLLSHVRRSLGLVGSQQRRNITTSGEEIELEARN